MRSQLKWVDWICIIIGRVEGLRFWSGVSIAWPVGHEETVSFLWTSVSLLCDRIGLDHHGDFETL